MPKLRVFSGQELQRLLERHGFVASRQRGSHVVMRKTTPEGSITTVIPEHDEVKVGTLRSIIRQSGLARELFEK